MQLQPASNSGNTPNRIFILVRQVFRGGIIELNLCSNTEAQAVVQARIFLTQNERRLAPSCLWVGSVFICPPFNFLGKCNMQAQKLAKALGQYIAARAVKVLLSLNVAEGCK